MSVDILQRTLPRGPVPDASLWVGRICDVLVVLVLLTACVGHFLLSYILGLFWQLIDNSENIIRFCFVFVFMVIACALLCT